MTIINPLYTNKLLNTLPSPLPTAPQPLQRQLSPEMIETAHNQMGDFQKDLRELIELPNDQLTLSKVFGAAADLVAKNAQSQGKRGATALQVASELAAPDFPKPGPDGQQPAPEQVRQFLVNHFLRSVRMQASLTSKAGPPRPKQSQAQAPQQPMGNNALMQEGGQ